MGGRFFAGNLLRLTILTVIQVSKSHPGRVSCKYCVGHSKNPWFLAKNLPQHLKCASHLKSVGEEQVRQETKDLLDHLHAPDLEQFQRSKFQYAPLSGSGQPEVPVPMKPPPEIGEEGMWEDIELDRPNASLFDANWTDPSNPMEQQEAIFYRALDRTGTTLDLTTWGSNAFDIECDVDETLTQVMQDLGSSKKGIVSESDGAYSTTRSR